MLISTQKHDLIAWNVYSFLCFWKFSPFVFFFWFISLFVIIIQQWVSPIYLEHLEWFIWHSNCCEEERLNRSIEKCTFCFFLWFFFDFFFANFLTLIEIILVQIWKNHKEKSKSHEKNVAKIWYAFFLSLDKSALQKTRN